MNLISIKISSIDRERPFVLSVDEVIEN